MKKAMKHVLCAMLIALLACAAVFAGGSKEAEQKDGYTKLVVAARTFGTVPGDLSQIQEEISKITREKIGCEIELLIIPSGSYQQQITLMLSGGEQLDCLGVTRALLQSAHASDQLEPLDDLLAEYGKDITEAVPAQYFKVGAFDGELYAITTNRDHARGYGGWLLRTDLLEKYNIDVSEVTTFDALTEVFQIIHDNEPQMTIVTPGTVGQSFLQWNVTFDNLNDYFGVLPQWGQDLEIVDLFTSQDYIDYCRVMREWYLRGFISKDILSSTESGITQMMAGNLFAYCNTGKPGIESQEELSSGTDLTYVQVLPTFTSTAAPITFEWTIPITSADPEKAMQFLNLMYSDSDVMNLLAYGIEGKHYVKKDDGTITYPEGVNSRNSGYNVNMAWQFGNEFIAEVWEGNDPSIWKQTEEWNTTGIFSKAMGFLYDNAKVQNEVAAVQNVYNEYRMSLECGLLEYDDVIGEMSKKMEAAGLQRIIEEKQRQLDIWAAENGVV